MNAIQNYVWGLSKPQQYEETIIEITTTQPNRTFEWYSVTGPVQYYDWNGTRTNSKAHTFASAGVYTIKIVGNINHFQTNKATTPDYFVTKVIQVASTITKFLYSFQNCRNLTSIPSGLFDKNVNSTLFTGCFQGCTGLTSIPSGLFDKNVNAIYFSSCFHSCTGLTSIPSGLFDKNVNAIGFESSFQNCRNLTSIPSGLFDKNVNAIYFSSCFHSCTGLTSIPSGLFDKNVKATGFNSSFFNCTSLTNRPKPHGLEMWQIEGTNGRPSIMNLIALFKGCTAMPDYTSIPIWIRN